MLLDEKTLQMTPILDLQSLNSLRIIEIHENIVNWDTIFRWYKDVVDTWAEQLHA